MKNTVFTALGSYQFHGQLESKRYFEARGKAEAVERNVGEPQTTITCGIASTMGALDYGYLLAHYLIQPERELLSYPQRDLWSGLGEETNRDALAFKLATLLAPVGSQWKHYNRPETYEVLAVARYYDRNEQFVVFCNASNRAEIWMRTVDDFFDRVRIPGSLNPPEVGDGWRFVRIDEVGDIATTEEQFAQQLTELYTTSRDTIIREQQAMTRKLFSRYLKHLGSKIKFICANNYSSGSIELVYEDATTTPTSLWINLDKDDPNPGQTILFMFEQVVQRVDSIQYVLDRAESEVKAMRATRQLAAVMPENQKDFDEMMQHIAGGFFKKLHAVFETVAVSFTKDHTTGTFQLLIQIPSSHSNRTLFSKFNAVEENEDMVIRRTWELPKE